MKMKFNKYYIIIAICIIANIFIFQFMSNKLESYVSSITVERALYDQEV